MTHNNTTQDATQTQAQTQGYRLPERRKTQDTKKFIFIFKEYDSMGHFLYEVIKTIAILNILMYIIIKIGIYIYG